MWGFGVNLFGTTALTFPPSQGPVRLHAKQQSGGEGDGQGSAVTNRIASLDGWRGIAILLVLIDHVQDSILRRYAQPWTQTGQHGVTIFFVLSGFLITTKLIERPIDLKRFYLRRFFRLMPAAWLYLSVLLLFDRLSQLHFVARAELWSCLLFYRNFYVHPAAGPAGHFWSLSLEEQFYLVWPCLLLLAGSRRCGWIAAGGAIACAAYRWLFWSHYDHNILDWQTQVRADALLVGCVLALILAVPRCREQLWRWVPVYVPVAFITLLYCVAKFHWLPPLVEVLAIAALIAATTLRNLSFASRCLGFAPIAWLGVVSYSIYIWQELFMPFRSAKLLVIGLPWRHSPAITGSSFPAPDWAID